MIRRLYDQTIALANHPRACWILALIACTEAFIFPIPPDIILIPMCLANPRRAWLYALITLFFSVLGGLLGYAIGAELYDSFGRSILVFYAKSHVFEEFAALYNSWGAWAVLIGAVTPIPYKAITILSGLTGLSLSVFFIASVIGRGVRFFLIAALLMYFGPPIRRFIERHLALCFVLVLALLCAGFLILQHSG